MTSVTVSVLLFSTSWGGVIENLPMPDKNSAKAQSSKTFVKRDDYKLGLGLKRLIELKVSDTGYIDDDKSIDVVVTVQDLTPDDEKERLSEIDVIDAMATFDEGKETYSLNDKKTTLDALKKVAKTEQDKNDKWLEKITQRRNKNIAKLAKKYGWEEHKSIKKALKDGASSFSVSLTKQQIQELYNDNQDVIAVMDLPKKLESSLSSAMIATKINPYALSYSNSRGSGIGIYINEANDCPNESIVVELDTNKYIRLGKSAFYGIQHSLLVSGVIRSVAPDATLYCDSLESDNTIAAYSNAFPPSSYRSAIQVESYSINAYNGLQDSDFIYNTDYQDIDREFDNYVYDNNKYVFVSAGNRREGTYNPNDYVLSPAKAFNVITVGNYDDTSSNTINQDGVNTSSYVNPSTGNQKPEISAPGTLIEWDYTARDSIQGDSDESIIMTGTSFAAPHAAAFAADAMSHNSFLNVGRAPMMKAHMIASATDAIGGGRNRVGEGGINFYSSKVKSKSLAYYNDGNSETPFPYIGTNSSGDWYCKTNWSSYFYASDSVARVVIAWANRGDFILQHGESGIDLDLHVRGPNGEWYYGEMNDNDPYAMVTFNPPTTGTYTAFICKTKDIDSQSRIDLGYAAVSY